MDIGQMAPTRIRKDAGFDDARRWIYKWVNTSGALAYFDTHKLAVRRSSQDMRQAALPRSSRLENGSVYIRMLYNRNNTADLSKWRLNSSRLHYYMQNLSPPKTHRVLSLNSVKI
jgi:hypothetical protein